MRDFEDHPDSKRLMIVRLKTSNAALEKSALRRQQSFFQWPGRSSEQTSSFCVKTVSFIAYSNKKGTLPAEYGEELAGGLPQVAGGIFWFIRNRLAGSYLFLSSASRS
jgi:hypothetical protein